MRRETKKSSWRIKRCSAKLSLQSNQKTKVNPWFIYLFFFEYRKNVVVVVVVIVVVVVVVVVVLVVDVIVVVVDCYCVRYGVYRYALNRIKRKL